VPLAGIACRLASSISVSTTKEKSPSIEGLFHVGQISEVLGSSRFRRGTLWPALDWR
jgi:hypothetical protein